MERLSLYNSPIIGSYSLQSLAEGSVVISEAEEINEVISLHEQGNRATSSKEFDEAVSLYNEALEIDSKNASVLAARAFAYMEIKNYAGALQDAESALAIEPENSEVHCALGLALHYLGHSRDGLTHLLTSLDLDLDNADNLSSNIAMVATSMCNVPESVCENLKDMDTYKKLTEVGSVLFQSKKFEICIQVLEVAQKLQTNQKGITMRLLLTLANALTACKKQEQAINYYMECYSLSLATHDALYQTKSLVNIATLYLDGGDTYQAIIFYEKLHQLERELIVEHDSEITMPEFWTKQLQCGLHLNLSIAYKSIGNMNSAIVHAKSYVDLLEQYGLTGKMYAESYHNTGMLNEILGKYLEAMENYKKYLALSKKQGNKKGMAQAYGCLGTIYAALHNWQISITYHEQHIKIAQKSEDKKMLVIAYEMLGDTYMLQNDYDKAISTFELMLNSCIRTDHRNKATAFCKLGNAYRAQGKHQYSLYFYEHACDLARDFDFDDIETMSEYNIACMHHNSTQMAEIEQSRKYFLKLIPLFEKKINKHQEQGTHCPEEYRQQLKECYDGVVNVLAKMGNKEECLEYAENCRKRCITELPNFSTVPGQNVYGSSNSWDMWSFQKLARTVSGQNATILYYSLLDYNLLLWVLQPADGMTRFYAGRAPKDITMTEKVTNMIDDLFLGMTNQNKQKDYENRAVPGPDSLLKAIRIKNQKLSKPSPKQPSAADERKLSDDLEAKNRPLERQLYDILLSPIEDILSKLDPQSNLIIIPDKQLHHCPFGILQNWTLKPLADRFNITYLPCLLLLDRVLRNEIDSLRAQDELKFERSQSRCGGVSKLLKLRSTGSPYSDTPDLSRAENVIVNLKSVSNPRLLTSQGSLAVERGKSVVSFGLSRENTFLSLSSKNEEVGSDMSSPKSIGIPVSPEKMLSTHTFTTITSQTATGTDIIKSSQAVTEFVQMSSPERCLVIGMPSLPPRLMLDESEWKPSGDMLSAKRELNSVAKILDVDPILLTEATKEKFLFEIQRSTIIHIATYGCLEKGYLVFSPNPRSQRLDKSLPTEESYLVRPEDILNIKLQCQLVVINVGYTPNRSQFIQPGYILPALFLAAGAQCVLVTQWQLPDYLMEKFYHYFYLTLQSNSTLTDAVRKTIQHLKDDERCDHYCLWCPFILIGKDISIDIKSIRHAMLNQVIDKTEKEVEEESGHEYLNLKSSITHVASPEENKKKLQDIIVKLLSHCPEQVSVAYDLIELLDAALKRLHTEENNRMTSQLTTGIITSNGGLELLKFLGFHFQAKGSEITEPYIVYPHWNLDSLLIPAYDALRALTDLSSSPRCCQVICDVLPLSQDNISLLVDLLSITKHAAEIQLKVSDLSVRPLWHNKQIKKLLVETGYHQIGLLLNFNQTLLNKKLLMAVLQLLLAVSCYKSQILLYRLDVNLLGHASAKKSYYSSSESKNLPSLTPLILPRNQLRMSTPWLSQIETFNEMEEKMKLARSKSDLQEEYEEYTKHAKSWHHTSVIAQANDILDKVGRPKSSPSKIKVVHGSGGMKNVKMIQEEPTLVNKEVDQRRDYAHFVFNQRLENIGGRHKNDVMKLYLPYIKST
ncbi:hypothetical protein SNE40_001029 [Patella caerulea]|uniref:CHAT domain-containing protein n=1 Tax=Patella caerulea TaxID=87958 RepID=A0AAN8QHP0_PATCE